MNNQSFSSLLPPAVELSNKHQAAEKQFNESKSFVASIQARLSNENERLALLQQEEKRIRIERQTSLANGVQIDNLNIELKKIKEDIELSIDSVEGLKALLESRQMEVITNEETMSKAVTELQLQKVYSAMDEYNKVAPLLAVAVQSLHEAIRSYKKTGKTFYLRTYTEDPKGALSVIPRLCLEQCDVENLFRSKHFDLSLWNRHELIPVGENGPR